MLEEYVDGLHFIIDLGIESNCEWYGVNTFTFDDTTKHFIALYSELGRFRDSYLTRDLTANGRNIVAHKFRNLHQLYLGLGIQLGFTLEQIEQAYYEKNRVNHERQNNGY